ncbi:zinc-binding alcohol dehydrogenase family protein [Rhizosaccharibacter radicis]|uniref:Zinc-binding alcohol dehydrogenase family protein n=1 Tax=Rhizosaccharibacter radicis TaxID=2782605 RepID=A0ABT1VSJ7_9PROT|nr:zinc-binding alcohol dehydrogenase family protein [Acetobacteraceae bacterium KSS12]
MKAAIVHAAGEPPRLGEFTDPVASGGTGIVRVAAASMSHLTFNRAAGTHYSSAGRFPFVPGVDGVGRLPDGRRVFFVLPEAPFGSMAERALVRAAHCVPVPDALDDVAAAALVNPAMSSWGALTERARLRPGETVLVNGATGMSGRLAVRIARHMGAGRVVATGRNRTVLDALDADIAIPLDGDEAAQADRFREAFAAGVDVVLDYLWGPSAAQLLRAAARSLGGDRPLRMVQIGAATGDTLPLSAALLRSAPIALMGSGLGSITDERLIGVIGALLAAAPAAGLVIPAAPVPLDGVEGAWSVQKDGRRVVFVP